MRLFCDAALQEAATVELAWIFKAQGLHKESLAALKLFCEAARREEATAKLAREVLDQLKKATE